MLQVLSFREDCVPAELRVQVLAMAAQAFGGPPPQSLGPVHDPALNPRSMLLVDDGRVLSALDILAKDDLTHAGHTWSVAGLSSVVTCIGVRGKGHGRRLVSAARSAMAESRADLALFTCDRPLKAFYLGCGFEVLSGAVLVGGTVGEPLRSDSFDKVVLGCFFSDRSRVAAPQFAGTDIALYPGLVDRLW